jgi:hypothetical protein
MSRTATTAQVTRYAQYRAEVSADGRRFEITKVGYTTSHPMNWSAIGGETSREGAWEAARQQHLPVVYCDATSGADTNQLMELGEVFDPQAFERAAYSGDCSYAYSMTDYGFHPIAFETWVKGFRAEVLANVETIKAYADAPHNLSYADKIWTRNDLSDSVRAALPVYAARLQAATR